MPQKATDSWPGHTIDRANLVKYSIRSSLRHRWAIFRESEKNFNIGDVGSSPGRLNKPGKRLRARTIDETGGSMPPQFLRLMVP